MPGLGDDGHPLFPGHRHNGTGHPGGGGGGGGTSAQHGAPDAISQQQTGHPAAGWVVRRQQALRRAGFNVAVDGVWGPQSQAAWARYTGSLGSGAATNAALGGTPIHMVKIGGKLYQRDSAQAKQARKIQQAVTNAKTLAKAHALNPHTKALFHFQQMHGITGHPGSPVPVSTLHDQAGADQKRLARIDRHEAIRRNDVQTQVRLDRLMGPGQKFGKDFLHLRAREGGLSVDDLRFLVDHDVLNETTTDDVRIIQQSINAHLPGQNRIKVSGEWTTETNTALTLLWVRREQWQFENAIRETKKTLIDTGIARRVTTRLYGHAVTDPATLIRLLQGDSPQAKTLAKTLGRAYLRYEYAQQLETIRDQATAQVLAPGLAGTGLEKKFLDALYGAGNHDLALTMQGGGVATALRDAKNLPQLKKWLGALHWAQEWQKTHELQARHQPGFWSEKLGSAAEILGWSGHQGGRVYTVYAGLTDSLFGKPFGKKVDHWGRPLDLNPLDQWNQSERTLDEMNPWERLIYETAFDPLNLVGVGLVDQAVKTTFLVGAKGFLRSGDLAFRAADRFTVLDHFAAGAYRTAETLHVVGEIGPTRALSVSLGHLPGVSHLRASELFIKATTTKADAIRKVNLMVSEAYVTTLRKMTMLKIGASVEGRLARITEEADELASVFDPALLNEVVDTNARFSSALRQIAPEMFDRVAALPLSLYQTAGRVDGTLSVAGAEIAAWLTEHGGRALLARYAILDDLALRLDLKDAALMKEVAGLPIDQLRVVYESHYGGAALDTLMSRAGSYFEGHVRYEWADKFEAEMATFRDRLYHYVMPALDDEIRLRYGVDSLFDLTIAGQAGKHALAREFDDEARAALDDFFGYSVKDAYDPKNYVKVLNPNYGVRVAANLKDELIDREITRRAERIRAYAERRKRLGGDLGEQLSEAEARSIDERANAWVARETRGVERGWRSTDDGFWFDARKSLRVPVPTARNITREGLPPALAQGERVAGHLTDIGRPRTPGSGIQMLEAQGLITKQIIDQFDNQLITQFAEDGLKLDALYNVATSQILSKAYLTNGFFFRAMKESQEWHLRQLYNLAYVGMRTWKLASLPGHFYAFTLRNRLDNFFKSWVRGMRDPREWFTEQGGSLFSVADVRGLKFVVRQFDLIFKTEVEAVMDRMLAYFWEQHPNTLSKIFEVQGVPIDGRIFTSDRTIKSLFVDDSAERAAVPLSLDDNSSAVRNILPEGIENLKGAMTREGIKRQERALRRATGEDTVLDHAAEKLIEKRQWVRNLQDGIWDLLAAKPESFAQKTLYGSIWRKEMAKHGDEQLAMKKAWEAVEETLFDYSKITVIEDNLTWMFPFIFFWRKNATIWAKFVKRSPGLFATGNRLYDLHREGNADLPDWMRRYVSLAPVGDLMEWVPGLEWMAGWARESVSDPMNYISIVAFYRSFKGQNPDLPADKAGWPFISGLVNGMNSIGLGVNPFWSDAGQRLGVLDRQSWRDIFPQTTLLQALTDENWIREQLGVDTPGGFNIEDWIADPVFRQLGSQSGQSLQADRFNYLVQQEQAILTARGEDASRERAEQRVRSYVLFQTLVGFAIGLFPRRMTNEQIAYYQLIDTIANGEGTIAERRQQFQAEYLKQTPAQQDAYRLFRDRGYDPVAFDRERRGIELSRAYYAIDDYDERQAWLRENPEALPIVNPILAGGMPSERYIQTQMLLARTDTVMQYASHFLNAVDASPEVRSAAYNDLVTPSLAKFWAANDTATQVRDRQIAGAFHQYVNELQESFFAIPDDEFDAREQFLNRHPVLNDYWNSIDGAGDDYRALMLHANSTFRTIYFDLVNTSGWDAATEFLRLHPFIFDFTSAEGRIDPGGNWLPRGQAQADYSKVAPLLRVYYSLAPSLRDDYLRANPIVASYFQRYGAEGGLYQQARDWESIEGTADAYFALPLDRREAFLAAHPELRAYFAKYAQQRQVSQHARDYLAIKPILDQFFALPESKRSAYLARHPELQAYFDKYGSHHGNSSPGGYGGAIRESLARHPEIADRYEFWLRFFALKPSERPAFIHNQAEQHGIFIYGSLSYDSRQRQIARWHREAVRLGQTDKAYFYILAAPLLKVYFRLPEGSAERALFLEMNPELGYYFDHYSRKGSASGDPHIDKLLERYFGFQAFSQARQDFITAHPELRAYFNRDASPREQAMQRQIDRFFKLPFGPARDRYLAEHPEIRNYFDQRSAENDLFGSLAAAFNANDPRMAKYREMYEDIPILDAFKQYQLSLHKQPTFVGSRRERQPVAAADELSRRTRQDTL